MENTPLNDYARMPVPQGRTVSFWRIGLIYIGVGLALPAFIQGAAVGLGIGLTHGLLATALAGIVLSLLAALTGRVGAASRLSTYYIVRHAFGRAGGGLINLVLVLTVLGWFGITTGFLAASLDALWPLGAGSRPIWGALGGALMTATAIWGFRGLHWLSVIAVPALFGGLAWLALSAAGGPDWAVLMTGRGSGELPFSTAVSMLVGGWAVGVAVLPDLTRYARTLKDGMLGGAVCFLPGMFVIMALCMIPALSSGEGDIAKILTAALPPLAAGLIVLLASWSTNDNNLYAASLGLASIVPGVPKWALVLVCGLAGTALGLAGILDHFIPFLITLSLCLPPVAGIYVSDYFAAAARYTAAPAGEAPPLPLIRWPAVTGLILGCATAFAAIPPGMGGPGLIQATGVPGLDGALVAGVVTYGLARMLKI